MRIRRQRRAVRLSPGQDVPAGTVLSFTNLLTASGSIYTGTFTRIVASLKQAQSHHVFDNATVSLAHIGLQDDRRYWGDDAGNTYIDE